ncbi:hypothetical protein KVT40_002108 [Elsinoe batatas]|uniref:Uncharacterized protein n=1 Tax=Elsinoe batatas TaxID=2601811 RepID=A0A8K0L8K1_9PEZI|nr:hypothetical protein KVT40_002108 [Elsinoe batatas]
MMRTLHQHDNAIAVKDAVGHGCKDVCFRHARRQQSFGSPPPRPRTWLRTLVIFRKIGRSSKRSSRRCHRSRVAQARTNLCGTRTNTELVNRLVQRQTQRNLSGLGSPLQTGAKV